MEIVRLFCVRLVTNTVAAIIAFYSFFTGTNICIVAYRYLNTYFLRYYQFTLSTVSACLTSEFRFAATLGHDVSKFRVWLDFHR